MPSRILALALCSAAAAVSAQLVVTPDRQENEAPPPPALRTQGLIPIEIPGATLRFGVDPASIAVGSDSIVRYVVVATSSTGTVNAIYEGLRCATGEVKVYARHNPDSGWVPARNSEWQDVSGVPHTRHSLAIARSGACFNTAPNGPAVNIVRALRAPVERRFESGGINRF